MNFSALHRILGAQPGPLTDEMLDDAVSIGAAETKDLDWKRELPPAKGLNQTDYPKDVAAMANSGGGMIIFGVAESQKAATGRVDVGAFDETYERSLRSAAISAISPPVFDLKILRLGDPGRRAVVVEVPASIDGPHLIYKNDYFGAPVRNDSDTVWMKEWQIEAMYRARLEGHRRAMEALDKLYADVSAGRNTHHRAWLNAVARPRISRFRERLGRNEARDVLSNARTLALSYAGNGGIHPLLSVEASNPRIGLRRWVATSTTTGGSAWKESWVSIYHDGSVTLSTAVGGHPSSSASRFKGNQVKSSVIECSVADFMALIRVIAETAQNDEYDLRVGVEWTGGEPLEIFTVDQFGFLYDDASVPLYRYTPVEATIDATATDFDYRRQVRDLAEDCVNQGGISNLTLINSSEIEE